MNATLAHKPVDAPEVQPASPLGGRVIRFMRALPVADRVVKEQVARSLRRWRRRSDPAQLPVFIVGSGRCGTTLLGVILDTHPNIAITPETQMFPVVLSRLLRARGIERMVETLFTYPRIAESGVTREEMAAALRERSFKTPSTLLECFYASYAKQRGKPRWGDNTPGYARCMPLINKLFGGAYFIHLIRDGRDVATSVMPLSWGPNTVPEAARWWKEEVLGARRLGATLPHYCEVRYEDLLRDPEGTLRRICDFLKEPYAPAMLHYEDAGQSRLNQLTLTLGRLSAEERKQSQTRIASGLDPSRIGRWREHFSETESQEFLAIAGDLLRELKYEDAPRGS